MAAPNEAPWNLDSIGNSLQEVNPSLDPSSIDSSCNQGGVHPSLSEEELESRLQATIEPMTETFASYFKPKEIVNLLDGLDDKDRKTIERDSVCNSEGGMRSLLETLLDAGGPLLVDFYKLVTSMDEETGCLPMRLLNGTGCQKQEKLSRLMDFLVEMVEQRDIERLKPEDMLKVVDVMQENDFLKKGSRQRQTLDPVQAFNDLLTKVKRSKSDWPFFLMRTLRDVRPGLFLPLTLKADNESSISTEGASLETASSHGPSELSIINPSGSSGQSSASIYSDEFESMDMEKLNVQDIDEDGLNMILDAEALDKEQTSSEGVIERKHRTRMWVDQQPVLSDDDDEETERKVPGVKPSNLDTDLKLREYQKELAKDALQGLNTIVFAPTGSGKTRVALEIILKHLMGVAGPDRSFKKVCFFAQTVPLAVQQHKIVRKYLPEKYKVNLFTGDSEENLNLHLLLDSLDVVVLTPMVLLNHLTMKSVKGLDVFSLLVFDECHHTREKEPYNNLMSKYVDAKLRGDGNLPQVVGLTASIPMEKANNQVDAENSILQLCANLDASTISKVTENETELKRTVAVPIESMKMLNERKEDHSFQRIMFVMEKLEEKAVEISSGIVGAANLFSNKPPDRKHQGYQNWAVECLKKAEKLPRGPGNDRLMLMLIAYYLKIFHFALEAHDLVHLQDVIEYLNDQFAELKEVELATTGESKLYDYFDEVRHSMRNLLTEVNPNLVKLTEEIRDKIVNKGSSSRGIIFIKTRAIAEALVSWLNRCDEDDIRELRASIFTSTNVPESEGGLTQSQQTALLEKFRQGKVKLLVATTVANEGLDIPDCNLVIKYNHIGNDVTTIQTRGRSRKMGGHCVLLALPDSGICERERQNKMRTKLMDVGIEKVRGMGRSEFVTNVSQIQKSNAEKRRIEKLAAETARSKLKDKTFSLKCKNGCPWAIESVDIRITVPGNARVVVNRDAWQHMSIELVRLDDIDEAMNLGYVRCRYCRSSLGRFALFRKVPFLLLNIKSFLIQEHGLATTTTASKWKGVKYVIEELSHDDIIRYLKKRRSQSGVVGQSLSGVQETEPPGTSHHGASLASSLGCSSQRFSRETGERHGTAAMDSSVSAYSSSSGHHETQRKLFMDT